MIVLFLLFAEVMQKSIKLEFTLRNRCHFLQVVGNLIYYRYMNPAIVAPDAFDIVSFGAERGLTPDQVHSLDFSLTGKYL